MGSIPINDTEHWHALRSQHIGGTEVAALPPFNLSPYLTHYELWNIKAGKLPATFEANDRMIVGSELEAGIAAAGAKIVGLRMRKVRRYVTSDAVDGLGVSLDYEVARDSLPDEMLADAMRIAGEQGATLPGWIPTDIKNVDYLVFRDNWKTEDDGVEPPLHIDLQLQAQMACTGSPVAFVMLLVGGNDLRFMLRPRVPAIVQQIERSVHAFWASIKDGHEPTPDYAQDGDVLKRVLVNVRPGEVDMKGHNRLEDLIGTYVRLSAEAKATEEQLDAVKAEILDLVGEAETVLLNGGKVTAKLREAEPERVVSITYKAKPPRRELRVYPKKAAFAVAAE